MSTSDGLTLVGLVITLGIAVVGWATARRADRRTSEALRLAQSAEERADRLEKASLERRDVEWAQTWTANTPDSPGGLLSFRNAGTDSARGVELVVDYEPPPRETPAIWERGAMAVMHPAVQRVTCSSEEIAPNETISVSLPEFASDVWSRVKDDGDDSPILRVAARLTWKSKAGVPGTLSWPDLELRLTRWLSW